MVDRRLLLVTLDTAEMIPVRDFASIAIDTLCPTESPDASVGATSSTICGSRPVKSAICDPILTDCHTFPMTRAMTPSTGAVTRSLLASRSACSSAIFAFSRLASSCMIVARRSS